MRGLDRLNFLFKKSYRHYQFEYCDFMDLGRCVKLFLNYINQNVTSVKKITMWLEWIILCPTTSEGFLEVENTDPSTNNTELYIHINYITNTDNIL